MVAAILLSTLLKLTPAGAGVEVFNAPLDAPPDKRSMPAGCTLLVRKPAIPMPELDLLGQKDPFRKERNETAAAGGNALLVLSRMTVSRHDDECPSAVPITDCAPSFGAWYRVVVESYTCSADALKQLNVPAANTRR